MVKDLASALDELLADPLIQLVMKADNVDAAHVHSVYRQLQDARGDVFRSVPNKIDVPIFSRSTSKYRAGVGIMLLNERGEVFIGHRIAGPADAWQMPEGGIKPDETPRSAAFRDLRKNRHRSC